MITLRVYEDGGQIRRFTVSGHAGYARKGSDIVCAAVSALVYNAINSCEQLLHTVLPVQDDGDTLVCDVPAQLSSDSVQLLLRSMVFGVEQTASSYRRYVRVEYHHVPKSRDGRSGL